MAETTTTETDRVVYRTWRALPHETIALFIDMPEHNGLVNSYMHIGQHGAASYAGVVEQTRQATDAEAATLEAELIQIGYHPRRVRRNTRRR